MQDWERTLEKLPSDWYEKGRASQVLTTQAITAAFCVLQGRHSREEVLDRILFPKIANTSLKNALKVITQLPEHVRNAWDGKDGFAVTRLCEIAIKYRKEVEKGTPVVGESQQRIRDKRRKVSLADAVREFVGMLSIEALGRAWKFQASVYSTDRPNQGDAVKATRLNELWTKIRNERGESI